MTSNQSNLATESPSSPEAQVSTTSSSHFVVTKNHLYKQRPLGPAPFASFEDLSDELESPPETARIVLPCITEDPSSQLASPNTPLPIGTSLNLSDKEEKNLRDALKSSLVAATPPRIDISRASSSSQHEDSLTSSPDRENGSQNLGYKEEGTMDLRSSTEELDFIREPGTVEESEERKKREKMMKRQQQVRSIGDTQSQHEWMERKDSNCSVMSDVGLLCISGRTSRLSSIGSAASGGSIASGASHLSVGSHLSGRSTRSPSPHKMLLETSFCGSRQMLNDGIESEISADTSSTLQKSASRPPSRLYSRSPSPHKMLLETSFCGTKKDSNKKNKEFDKEVSKFSTDVESNSSLVTADAETVQKSYISAEQTAPKPEDVDKKKRKDLVNKSMPIGFDKIKRMDNALDNIERTSKPKNISQKNLERKSAKPKKVISLRDLPVDEIYIPLKGPEVDFEEIIRKASPNLKKKPSVPSPTSKNEIFIPLHSPPKSYKKEDSKDAKEDISKRIFMESTTSRKFSQIKSGEETDDSMRKQKLKTKREEYEICEDGSIFIPLHSPSEVKSPVEFDNGSNGELGNDKKSKEKQSKPQTLDLRHLECFNLVPETSNAEKPEESITPSPGSSLSRKSSFVNLFKKSDAFGSPDSQSGLRVRKKSANISNVLKETSDGLREKSQTRGKSKEQQPLHSAVHSPSGKKNVFSNLFGKKKPESKFGKENSELSTKLDLQFNFDTGMQHKKGMSDEGDYIIIPLRDPDDPSNTLERLSSLDSQDEILRERVTVTSEPPQSVATLEAIKSPKNMESKRLLKEEEKEKESVFGKSDESDGKRENLEEKLQRESEILATTLDSISMQKAVEKQEEILQRAEVDIEPNIIYGRTDLDERSASEGVTNEMVDKEGSNDENCRNFVERSLKYDSSLDLEEKGCREEVVTVSANGIRKLKLPPEPGGLEEDHERKGLVYQESFEDELPYIPTTLPLERSRGVSIVPIKHRMSEIKTCPIERPRSTTPKNPTNLEDFVNFKESLSVSEEEKMKISLPKDECGSSKAKSPRRYSAKGKSWFEFAEEGLQSPRDNRKSSLRTSPSPPPLPPRSSSPSVLSTSAPPVTASWINFDELPEKRKLPKKITTVPPLRSSVDGGAPPEKSAPQSSGSVVYNYVSPEDCQCECHDQNTSHTKDSDSKKGTKRES